MRSETLKGEAAWLSGSRRGIVPWFSASILFGASLASLHLVWLILAASDGGWAAFVPGLLVGILAADLLTGLIHWACDTWGDERTPWLGPHLIRSFREHHRAPRAMLEHDWVEVNREAATAATVAFVLLTFQAPREMLEGHVFAYAFLWALISFSALANQLHWWAHCRRPARLVRALQRSGLILSNSRHARHHRAPHNRAYCISTGWLNPALDAVRFWRALERAISFMTGVQPRERDRDHA